jgi:hypothetical protein
MGGIMAKQIQAGQQQPLSTVVYQFAEAQQIGAVVKEYKGGTLTKSLLGISLSVLGTAFIIVGVAAIVNIFPSFGKEFYALIIGIGFLGFGITQVRGASRNQGAQVYVGTDGLMRVKGNQAESIRWDQIAAVQKAFTKMQNNYFLKAFILLRSDRSALTLEKSFKDFNELGKTIEEEVTRRMLPGAVAAYNAGSPVNFGAIMVSYQGISVQNGQKTLGWNEFKTIKVYDGRVTIKKQGAMLDWEKLLIPQVPNLCVLVALIDYITRGQKPQ